ncbi:phage holin family protein [Providencia huaxiensis]|uniref:phage holin family protein n=2 Tax=Providencia TaxID=586 RepID=UPI000E108687|nr:phage holin family protein [Providencia huaxiensis]AXH61904.1 holin [Providencia huaxiensis]
MFDKDPNSFGIAQWLLMLFISMWGGVVRYIIDVKTNNVPWSWFAAFMQMVVSGFVGLLGGLLCIEGNQSIYITLFTTGVFGAMGSIGLSYLWSRFTGGKHV